MTGRGFVTGLLDAESQAHSVAQHPDDVAAALREAEQDRLGDARRLVRSGMGISDGLTTTL